ncbi:MAG: FIST C-terminal domain-containing protein, partial [Elusimicrobia bacterium]|nr:FIST C-terminal domain-containing protein [Elusimicrobiota bacterium]
GRDPVRAAAAIAAALGRAPRRRPLGLLLSTLGDGRNEKLLRSLQERLPGTPFFGGVASGDHDAGMGDPSYWRNWQYAGARLTRDDSRLALLDLPPSARVGFGFEHGWCPVGPPARVTRADGGRVREIDGASAVDYYRRFFGGRAGRATLLRSIQRYALALRLEGEHEGKTLLKLPVRIGFEKGWVDYYPPEELEGRVVQLIAATRGGVVDGARAAARRALKALGGRRPSLALAVSCCTRGGFLNSRIDAEMNAAREVFGRDVPLFGFYSGGELMPFLSRYEEAADPARPFGGAHYHTSTVGFLALSLPGRAVVGAPDCPPAACRVSPERMLAASEAALDDVEGFMGNLSRKSVDDAETLRRQSDVIRRYTPHGVWREAGTRAARGVYELPDAAFDGAFLFMDVKGFTSFAETRAPREVVAALNELLGPAADAVHACGGDVDKFVGDSLFAAFRRPEDAVEAGRRILEHAARRAAAGGPFSVRVGINAGRAVRANVGSGDRREYTYIGDAVNLSQRLESNATPGRMLVSASVYAKVRARWPRAPRRRLTVKGKSRPITAFELRIRAPRA